MGDRTHVALTLFETDYDKVKNLSWFDAPDSQQPMGTSLATAFKKRSMTENPNRHITLEYEEVNYGDLDFLYCLKDNGIPYDSRWSDGDNYGAGTAYLRFTPKGEAIEITVPDGQENPPLPKLMDLISDPQALVDYIVEFHDSVTPLPWDNQQEYAKLYLTMQLLKP